MIAADRTSYWLSGSRRAAPGEGFVAAECLAPAFGVPTCWPGAPPAGAELVIQWEKNPPSSTVQVQVANGPLSANAFDIDTSLTPPT
jgi:hypothetical protein